MIDPLMVIAAIWLLAASVTDLKKSEVSDWLSFSLLAIALSLRSAQSVFMWDYHPIITSLIGTVIFLIIANVLYYGKLFAGGDAKLLISLGAVIPSFAFLSNLLIVGGVYGIFYSIFLAIRNHRIFIKDLRKNLFPLASIVILFMAVLIIYYFTRALPILIFSAGFLLISFIFIFVNTVEKSCLILKISPKKLTVGDWLFKDVKIGKKVIRANFGGLTKREISMIQMAKMKVYVKYGIPFIPVFFISFIVTVFWGNLFLLLV